MARREPGVEPGVEHVVEHVRPTIDKRCTLRVQDLCFEVKNMSREIHELLIRGVKGTMGTQAAGDFGANERPPP